MIVSYARNFIFLKTRKTAGTTVEIALTPSCGPGDILTLITLEDELRRCGPNGIAARNYVADKSIESSISDAALAGNAETFRTLKRKANRLGAFRNHMTAADLRQRLPQDFWRAAYKFTIERHPYEKVVSRAYWSARAPGAPDIAERIETAVSDTRADVAIYSIDGAVAVDEILRQEHLEDDLRRVARKLDLSLPAELPKAKGRFRTDRRPAAEILSERQKRIVYERNAETFERMGYQR